MPPQQQPGGPMHMPVPQPQPMMQPQQPQQPAGYGGGAAQPWQGAGPYQQNPYGSAQMPAAMAAGGAADPGMSSVH